VTEENNLYLQTEYQFMQSSFLQIQNLSQPQRVRLRRSRNRLTALWIWRTAVTCLH